MCTKGAPIHVDADVGHLLDAGLAATVVADLHLLSEVSATAAVSVDSLLGHGGLVNLGLGTGAAVNLGNIADLSTTVAAVVGDGGLVNLGGGDGGVAAAAASAVAGPGGVAAAAASAVAE